MAEALHRQLRAMGIDADDVMPVQVRGVGMFSLGGVALPGDHIAILRCGSQYWQHAIFVGSICGDLAVIEQTPSAIVHKTPFETYYYP